MQVKGIGELLEGLIPYSQRHFSRIDRLERSTFLLDYTLIGMSVIEPEANRKSVDTEYTSDDATEANTESGTQPISETPQKKGSKKRKPKKSSEVSHKKVKKLPAIEASAISLKA